MAAEEFAQAGMAMHRLSFFASVILLAAGLVGAWEPQYTIEVMGAWDDGVVRVSDMTVDPGYDAAVNRAVARWDAAADAHAAAKGPANLAQLSLSVVDPQIPEACVETPGGPDQRQRLVIGGIETCLVLPEEGDLPDVVVVDSPLVPASQPLALGTTWGASSLLWEATDRPLFDNEGRYLGPVLVFVRAAPDLVDANKFNIALHELGHAFGLGHTDSVSGDPMSRVYTATPWDPEWCLATLDLAGLGVAYAWLGNGFENPEDLASIPVAEYALPYCG